MKKIVAALSSSDLISQVFLHKNTSPNSNGGKNSSWKNQ